MRFEPVDIETIKLFGIKRIFYTVEDTTEGVTFEQLKMAEGTGEELNYCYWDSAHDDWNDGYFTVRTDKQYYILERD